MKLPITEKFLWDVYNLIEGVSDVYTAFSLPSLKDVLYPEWAEVKRMAKKRKSRKAFADLIYYLKKNNLIKVEKKKMTKIVIITKKGWNKVLKIALKKEKLKQRKDKRWVMVIFDILEKDHRLRDFFRKCLKQLGFQMLQKSIWVSPYDVLEKVENLIKGLKIEKYTRLMVVEEIELR